MSLSVFLLPVRTNLHWLFQPKSEDEEGWKKFCLGEKAYSETVTVADNENLGIDYIQVGYLVLGYSTSLKYLRSCPTVTYTGAEVSKTDRLKAGCLMSLLPNSLLYKVGP